MTKKGGKKVKKAVIFPILTALLAVTVIYILRLYMIKSKCLINVVTGFEDYSEAENAAKYFGVDLPPRSDIVYGEYFVID